jgi:tetratricopeptide (TPR) repeat protein
MSEALDRLESDAWHPDDPSQPQFAHYTQAALTSQRAVSGAWMRRQVRYISGLVDAYAARRGKYERAAANPRAAVEPDPPLPEPDPDAISLLGRKDYAHALAAYDELCRSYPGFVQGHLDRAWVRATCPDPRFREGKLAVESARTGCELTDWSDAHALSVLAAALAETGDYPEASRWQEKAIERTANDADKKVYRDRLDLYRTGKPFRMD